jgi:hypothetical protein
MLHCPGKETADAFDSAFMQVAERLLTGISD